MSFRHSKHVLYKKSLSEEKACKKCPGLRIRPRKATKTARIYSFIIIIIGTTVPLASDSKIPREQLDTRRTEMVGGQQ